jgi:two-component system, sensor histidine kinase and response regulator
MISREHQEMARELHDSLGHSFTVVGIQLQALGETLGGQQSLALKALSRAQQANAQGLKELRQMLAKLNGSPLQEQDLLKSIQLLMATTQQIHFRATFEQAGDYREMSELTKLTIYRFFQEGLSNVCRHAQASTALLTLNFLFPDCLMLSLSDNGHGMQKGTGSGLVGLRERIMLLGGTFDISSSNSGGTLLEMTLPA